MRPATTNTNQPPHSEWPENRDAVRFLVKTQPDEQGLHDFWAVWWSLNKRRAQFFRRADLGEQRRRAWSEGVQVEMVDAAAMFAKAA